MHVETIIKKAEFFSEISELPLKKFEHTINYDEQTKLWKSKTNFKLGDEYDFLIFSKPDYNSLNRLSIFRYAGEIIRKSNSNIGPYEVEGSLDVISDSIESTVLSELGGITIEVPFMNYEDYSFQSLLSSSTNRGDNTYFTNMYLLLMTHQKERGISMPPILGKKEEIYNLSRDGKVIEIEKLLTKEIESLKNVRPGILKHVLAEAEKIKEFTLYKKSYFDTSVPLKEKFLKEYFVEIPGKNENKTYNILVIQEPGSFFSEKLLGEFEEIGSFGGSNIIPEYNLHSCMQFCETGQIDAIILEDSPLRQGNGEKILWANKVDEYIGEVEMPQVHIYNNNLQIIAAYIKGELKGTSEISEQLKLRY